MRRLSARGVSAGMVLGRTVTDTSGTTVCEAGRPLTPAALTAISIYGIDELFIQDARTDDAPVDPLIAPELEAEAAGALRQLVSESASADLADESLLEQAVRPVHRMVQSVCAISIGDLNTSPCRGGPGATSRLPARAAGLAAVLAARQGMGVDGVLAAALATLLMDAGHPRGAALPDGGPHPVSAGRQTHPQDGYLLLRESTLLATDVMRGVLEHHERPDGSGYPRSLKGKDISAVARTVAVADAYFTLISPGPDGPGVRRHEAVEYICAYAGEHFDPDIAALLARCVPIYPAGTMVRLNTGEMGVVIDPNPGHLGRPVVRVLYSDLGYEIANPTDVDLASPSERDRMVADTPEY